MTYEYIDKKDVSAHIWGILLKHKVNALESRKRLLILFPEIFKMLWKGSDSKLLLHLCTTSIITSSICENICINLGFHYIIKLCYV